MIEILVAVAVVSFAFGTEDYYFYSFNSNISRSTPMGIAAYRSALTLDWMAAEDLRQRELAAAFETEASPVRVISSDCVEYPKPTSGKIGRLMLELLKNLEGDEGTLVPELMQVLVRSKFLVESSIFDSEPDLHSLVKMPNVMMGEPHTTFPRILAIIWMLVTDPVTTKKYGWCPIKKVNKYLSSERSSEVAKQMRGMEIVVARARFIMEEFIQSITPTDVYQKPTVGQKKLRRPSSTAKHGKKRAHEIATSLSAYFAFVVVEFHARERSSADWRAGLKNLDAFPIYKTLKNVSTVETNIQEFLELQKVTEQSHILYSRSNTLTPMITLFVFLFVL